VLTYILLLACKRTGVLDGGVLPLHMLRAYGCVVPPRRVFVSPHHACPYTSCESGSNQTKRNCMGLRLPAHGAPCSHWTVPSADEGDAHVSLARRLPSNRNPCWLECFIFRRGNQKIKLSTAQLEYWIGMCFTCDCSVPRPLCPEHLYPAGGAASVKIIRNKQVQP
jgi:hypothetical protein